MHNTGKAIRMERIFNRNTKRTIVVPMDHGVTVGPIAGIEDIREAVTKMADGGANAGLVHKGLPACGHRGEGADFGLIVHLSASTCRSPFPNAKVLVCTVEEAIRLGADAVSVHCNIGDETEARMLEDLGRVSSQAAYWGMPLVAMVYARGPNVPDEYDPEVVAHCARVGMELGADVVKVNYTGDPESFTRVTSGLAIPAVIAGGPKMDSTEAVLRMVHDSLQAGGSGLSIGRNVFQHKNPVRMVQALHAIVHQDQSVEKTLEWLGDDGNP
jgi:class I fructose-bisphosphate aldolase